MYILKTKLRGSVSCNCGLKFVLRFPIELSETSCGIDVIALSARMTKARLTWKNLTLVNGCALSQDLQKLIVDKIVRKCGDINAGYFPGKF